MLRILSAFFCSFLFLGGAVSAHADQTETYNINFYDFDGNNYVSGDPSNTLMGTGTITVTTPDDSTFTVTSFSYNMYPGSYANPVEPTSNSYSGDLASQGIDASFVNFFGIFYGLDFYSPTDPLYTFYGDGSGWELSDSNTGFDDGGFYQISQVTSDATPEPGSFALLGTGVLGIVAVTRRRLGFGA